MITKDGILSLGFELKFEQVKNYSHWCVFKKKDLEISHQFRDVNNTGKNNHFNFRGKYNTNFKMYLKGLDELEFILNNLA